MGATQPESKLDRHLVEVAVVTLLGSMMTTMDTTIISVALPTLSRAFHSSLGTIQWTLTAYLLSLGVVLTLARWTIDRFGTRNTYLVSLSLFILGSALCGTARSVIWLIIFRAMQGVGGGMILPVGQTILTRVAGPARMGRAMAVVGVPSSLGIAIGPPLGGLLIDTLGWRWIFYINIPIGIAAIIWSLRILEKDHERHKVPLDFFGLFLLPPGITLLVFGLSELGNDGTVTSPVLVGLVGGIALLALFALHSLRTEKPLLNLRLFANRGFLTANFAGFMAIAAAGGGPFLASIYFQVARGYSPFDSGLAQGSLALGIVLTTPFAGRILDRSGPRRLAVCGLLIMGVATMPWLFLSPTINADFLGLSLFARGLGVGCVFTPLLAAGYAALDSSDMPTATTISNIGQRLSQVLAVAVFALVLQSLLDLNLGHHALLGSLPSKGPHWVAIAPMLSRAFSQTFIVYEAGIVIAILVALSLPKSTRSRARRQGVTGLRRMNATDPEYSIVVEGLD